MKAYTAIPSTNASTPNILTQETFYPIDLFTASLESCITLYSSVIAKKNDFKI